MSEFAGKTAVISGGAEGIGLSIATALGEEGMNIVLADIDKDNLGKASHKLQQAGVAVLAVALDVAGTETEHWLAKARQPDTKQALKDRVEEARSLGIFGAPTFISADGELFWGDDRLEAAIAWAVDKAQGSG